MKSGINAKGTTFRLFKDDTNRLEIDENHDFVVGEDGNLKIDKIPYGTYTIYETKAPDGCDLKIQNGYQTSGTYKGYVYIATVKVDDKIEVKFDDSKTNATLQSKDVIIKEKTDSKEGTGSDSSGSGPTLKLKIRNQKYINISGYIWKDIPNSKANTYNNQYDEGANKIEGQEETEKKITGADGIKIQLYEINGGKIKEQPDEINDGNYTFKNVDASKLNDYYIIFNYGDYNEASTTTTDNQYITVAPNFEATNTSKALVNKGDIKEADSALKEYANTGMFLGHILDRNSRRSTFYTSENNTIHDINLGIKKLPKESFTISNVIQRISISVNEHKYDYTDMESKDDPTLEELKKANGVDTFPKVQRQSMTDYASYSLGIYPSDIATIYSEDSNKLKVQVKYRIDITNNTNLNIEDLYVEDNLVIDSLKDTYDTSRYELIEVTNENTWKVESTDASTNSETSYKEYSTEENKKVGKNKTKTYYISFNVKDEAIKKILATKRKVGDTLKDTLQYNLYENMPTRAIADAYHTYHRKDYYWEWTIEGGKRTVSTAKNSIENHKTKTFEEFADAPYLKFEIPQDRTISGIVFKDTIENYAIRNNEVLGDGLYANNENVVKDMKVELVKKNNDGTYSPVNLYPQEKMLELYDKDIKGKFKKEDERWKIKDDSGDIDWDNYFKQPEIKTGKDGEYSIVGIPTGEYYVRFTYGNTEVIYKDGEAVWENGNKLKIYADDQYKSTIISQDNVKSAMKNGNDSTWYLNLQSGNKVNTAADDVKNFEYKKEINFTALDSTGITKNAYTPKINIPIVFGDEIRSKPSKNNTIENINFGIIEKPKIKMTIDKKISNITLKLQNGSVLVTGNPTQNIPYVANLDTIWNSAGSQYTKIEADNNYLYGSTLEVEYIITVTNESDVTYTSIDYYKYGEKDETKIAKIEAVSILDFIDPKFNIKSITATSDITQNEKTTENSTSNKDYYKAKEILKAQYQEDEDNLDNLNKLYEMSSTSGSINNFKLDTVKNKGISEADKSNKCTTSFKIATESGYLSENLDFTSYVEIYKVRTAKHVYSDPTSDTSTSNEIIKLKEITPTSHATTVMTPSTGGDRSMKNIISGIIVLIGLGGVIVCLKKIRK